MCVGAKRFSKRLGGSLVPFGEQDSGPNEAFADDQVLFEVEDLGPEESACFSG